ncbi:MAG TPA: NYN domain-containing protein [Candidatus Saccharimonadales bacterium]|nr:NYN domain-containing protein [Candidatus Saccharimonadales bacterium]
MTPKKKQPSSAANNYAFIDSQNLNLGTQRMGWKMDWRRFRKFLADKYGVTQAYMFIGYMSENESLYEYMHELGFLVVLKPTIDVTAKAHDEIDSHDKDAKSKKADEKDKPIIKGNVDAELVLYAMKELPNYDKAIIVSGDGDFFSLAEYLAEQGKLDHILTPNWQYSSLLKPFESRIVRLDQKRRQLAYHDRKKSKPAKK